MNKLPWNERVTAISINPSMASFKDVARLAGDLMEARQFIARLASCENHAQTCFVFDNAPKDIKKAILR